MMVYLILVGNNSDECSIKMLKDMLIENLAIINNNSLNHAFKVSIS